MVTLATTAYGHIFARIIGSSDDTLVTQNVTRPRALKSERESVHKQKVKGSTKFARYVFPTTQAIVASLVLVGPLSGMVFQTPH